MSDLSPSPKFKAFVAGTSTPLAGGKLYTYLAGTTTPQATAKDQVGTANTNPIILDANGECDIWLGAISYKYVLKDSLDVTQWTVDNVATAQGAFDSAIAALTINTWADIATTLPTSAGQIFTLKQHTSGGLGGGTLMAFAGSVADDGGTQKDCLGGFYLKRMLPEALKVDSLMFGAKGDGVQDDYTACVALVQYAKNNANSYIIFASGINKIGTNLVIDVPSNTSIEFNNQFAPTTTTGTAITLGSSSANTFNIQANMGAGIFVTRSTINFSGGHIGVTLANLANSKIKVARVRNFFAGINMSGTQANGGSSYNDVYIGDLTDNQYNLFLTASGAGYCNENRFWGGSFGFSSAYAGHYAGTYNIYEDYFPSSHLNNNKFFGPSLESSSILTVAAQIYGENTHLYSPRLEASGGSGTDFKIVLASTSQCCLITGGSGVNLGAITDSGTGNIYTTRQGITVNTIGTGTESAISAKTNVTNTNRVYSGKDTSGVENFKVQGDGLVGLTQVKYLTSAKVGTFTLAAGAATISNTSVTTNSVIRYSLKTLGGTIAAHPYQATITPATGFTVAGGGASNTSTYNYEIVEIA